MITKEEFVKEYIWQALRQGLFYKTGEDANNEWNQVSKPGGYPTKFAEEVHNNLRAKKTLSKIEEERTKEEPSTENKCPKCNSVLKDASSFLISGLECPNCDWSNLDGGIDSGC